ncbi:MAG: Hpt domain-containing protein, partial [Aliarcobacter sp.]|nr:Hpt domain-containing protein [Aliarcobacter sp.]
PISALTANAIKGDKEKFLDLGMDYYLSKPISVAKLKELFNIYLSSNETAEQKIEKQEIIEEKEEKIEVTSFNKHDAITQLGLDEEIVDMLLDNFFLTLDNDLKKIQDAIDSKNSESIVQAAHYLKGSCANLAMNDAVKILQEIETKAKEGEINFNLNKLNNFFNQIK